MKVNKYEKKKNSFESNENESEIEGDKDNVNINIDIKTNLNEKSMGLYSNNSNSNLSNLSNYSNSGKSNFAKSKSFSSTKSIQSIDNDNINFLQYQEKNILEKINVLENRKTQNLIDISHEINEINIKIQEASKNSEKYNVRNIKKMPFSKLSELEENLMSLLIKVNKKISEKEELIINDIKNGILDVYSINEMCLICKDYKIDTVIEPCNHFCVCELCSPYLKNCPKCLNEIYSCHKVYCN